MMAEQQAWDECASILTQIAVEVLGGAKWRDEALARLMAVPAGGWAMAQPPQYRRKLEALASAALEVRQIWERLVDSVDMLEKEGDDAISVAH